MKGQGTSHPGKRYDSEFKRESVRLADTSGKTDRQIERDLELYQGAIRRCRDELEADPIDAFPGTGHQKPLEEENRCLRRELDIARGRTGHPEQSSGHLLKDTESRFRFIKGHHLEFSVERMAKLLDVSTSGYYGWFSRPESEREQERLLLDVLVKAACEASRGRYGSLKISRALTAQGKPYRRNRKPCGTAAILKALSSSDIPVFPRVNAVALHVGLAPGLAYHEG